MKSSLSFMDGERTVKIIGDISRLINAWGGECSEWHVGVATDLERELVCPGDFPVFIPGAFAVARCPPRRPGELCAALLT